MPWRSAIRPSPTGSGDYLVRNANLDTDLSGIIGLAPFLSRETLDWLALRIPSVSGLNGLIGLAPFLSKDTLNHLVKNANPRSEEHTSELQSQR